MIIKLPNNSIKFRNTLIKPCFDIYTSINNY